MIFRHYRNRGIFSKGPWYGEYMLTGRRCNWILRAFLCPDCAPRAQWFAWKWIVHPARGPWIGPAKTRKALIEMIRRYETPDLKLITGGAR